MSHENWWVRKLLKIGPFANVYERENFHIVKLIWTRCNNLQIFQSSFILILYTHSSRDNVIYTVGATQNVRLLKFQVWELLKKNCKINFERDFFITCHSQKFISVKCLKIAHLRKFMGMKCSVWKFLCAKVSALNV